MTIDLSETKSAPADIVINAWAILRDVDVTVAEGTARRALRRRLRGHLVNEVPDVPEEDRDRVVRIHGHTLVCDVTVRVAEGRA